MARAKQQQNPMCGCWEGRESTWQTSGGRWLHRTGPVFLQAQQQNFPLNMQTGAGFFLQETGRKFRRKTCSKKGHFPGKQMWKYGHCSASFSALRPEAEKGWEHWTNYFLGNWGLFLVLSTAYRILLSIDVVSLIITFFFPYSAFLSVQGVQ